MTDKIRSGASVLALMSAMVFSACSTDVHEMQPLAPVESPSSKEEINPELWPSIQTPELDPAVEQRVDDILAKLTLEQKVGQVIQADSGSVTPEEVKKYRLGSVLSGGNSAPGPLPYADVETWLTAADAYFSASIDPDGVEIAIPIIWGIDAVHGHANLKGAVVFPHNIGLGAANNPDLIEQIAAVTALELRVSGHDWTFAPTLAVPQDDRWGRTYEGFSEDPALVASYGDRIVYGLQGHVGEPGFMGPDKVIPSAKHFVGDGGTENGVDQGDAKISEAELRDIHAAGYLTAIEAGAQTVMASFSAWQGQRMHGQKDLLIDVLKGRMNFKGFVVGDWNGHALIPGCTATDCPESLLAGVDMYMAPDSWKGLWESTYTHVESGRIPMERLDDAVRRILRVKIASGILEAPIPSKRQWAGNEGVLGSKEHRALARQAVRESLVLLKNEDQLLPLDPTLTVLVVGDGADDISKASGGWTLSWQGGDHPNSEFPNGQSILAGIQETATNRGGKVIFDPDGKSAPDADVVIAVYGEDPYAEFQGDVSNLDFVPNGFDTATLQEFRDKGTPVVSVFLSGRPLWTNPEINASSAFVAAWLPGSEGGGVADLLFQTDRAYDFTGRLSYSWPKTATQYLLNPHHPDYDPLFPLGYGLSFEDDGALSNLSEVSGLDGTVISNRNILFDQGQSLAPWQLMINDSPIGSLPYSDGGISITSTDKAAQEDSLRITFEEQETKFSISSGYGQDFSRESNGAMELVFDARSFDGPANIRLGMGCDANLSCEALLPITLSETWNEIRLTLSCFADRGVAMDDLEQGLIVRSNAPQSIGLSHVRIEEDTNGAQDCGQP